MLAVSASHLRKFPDNPSADIRNDHGIPPVVEASTEAQEHPKGAIDTPISKAGAISLSRSNTGRVHAYGAVTFSSVYGAHYVQKFWPLASLSKQAPRALGDRL